MMLIMLIGALGGVFSENGHAAMVSFTFDDGSPTVYETAFPILEKYGQKATFYVISDNVVYKYDNNVTQAQLLDLQTQGWEIGSHSISHPHSTLLPFLYEDELLSGWEKVQGLLYTYRTRYEYKDHAWLYIDDVKNWNKKNSSEEVDQATEGYYFDLVEGYLYLHLGNNESPVGHQIRAGSAERELKQSRDDLTNMGLNVKSFVSPYHDVDDSFIELVGQYYETIVGGKSDTVDYQILPIEDGNVDPIWLMRSPSVKHETTLEQLKTMVDEAIAADSWLIISLHIVDNSDCAYSWSPVKLEALAAYINELEVPVVTISEGLSRASLGYEYYVPYYTSKENCWFGVALANVSIDLPVAGNVIVYDQSGSTVSDKEFSLEPGGQSSFVVNGSGTTNGWVKVVANSSIKGLCFLGANNLMADIPFKERLATNFIIPHIAQDEQWDTEILFCNPNDSENEITFTLINTAGVEVAVKNQVISSYSSGVLALAEFIDNGEAVSGSVRIVSTAGIATFALYNNIKSGGTFFAGINAE